MANTVNGITANGLTNTGGQAYTLTNANRKYTQTDAYPYYGPFGGVIIQAQFSLDGAGGDIVIDDPSILPIDGSETLTASRQIYVIGLALANANASAMTTVFKTGDATSGTKTSLVSWPINQYGGLSKEYDVNHPMWETYANGQLIMNVNQATSGSIYYVIAGRLVPRYQ